MDHQISPRDNLFARCSIQNTETRVLSTFPSTTIPGISKPVNLADEASFAGTSFSPDQHAVASYVKVFTPKLINEFRAGFNPFRLDYTADQYQPGSALGNQLGVPNANVTPNEKNLPIFSPSSYKGLNGILGYAWSHATDGPDGASFLAHAEHIHHQHGHGPAERVGPGQ